MKLALTRDGQLTAGATLEQVDTARQGDTFFWLDIDAANGPDDQRALSDLLLHHFGFHPLAVEDAEHFGQRPKLEDYEDVAYMVARGAPPAESSDPIEVHLFIAGTFVVTVHRGPCTVLEDVRARIGRHHASEVTAPQILLAYLIVDGLTDSFFPLLSTFDETVDQLEDQVLTRPTEEQLGTIFDMKRDLVNIRKVIVPQRDMFAGLSAGVTELPGATEGALRYFRDLYDHLIRISDTVDSYRDLVSGVMDTHLSTVSNRLNVVMKQLAIIATVFLPLSFLTGFFGQNFAVLLRWIAPTWTFWALGLGTELLAIVLLVILFIRRGWLGGPTA